MGNQAWVILSKSQRSIASMSTTNRYVTSVVGLGYEEEFGPYRRIVQHAL